VCLPEDPSAPEGLGEEELAEVLRKALDGGVLSAPGQLGPHASYYQGTEHETHKYNGKQCCGSEPIIFGSRSWLACPFGSGSGTGAELDLKTFRSISDLNLTNYINVKDLNFVKAFLLTEVLFSTFFKVKMYLQTKFTFLHMQFILCT